MKILKGTVTSWRDEKNHMRSYTMPLRVLKHYSDVMNYPERVCNNRAYELSTVVKWAYDILSDCTEDYAIEIKYRVK